MYDLEIKFVYWNLWLLSLSYKWDWYACTVLIWKCQPPNTKCKKQRMQERAYKKKHMDWFEKAWARELVETCETLCWWSPLIIGFIFWNSALVSKTIQTCHLDNWIRFAYTTCRQRSQSFTPKRIAILCHWKPSTDDPDVRFWRWDHFYILSNCNSH